ncbi:DoxX family protein [Actinoplanes sp. KI2]|uniref:DoxX family protein n=1 Tax=Actinoplanes sp. KI2 TaxID=2983315 RepID=UPI0021D5FAD4|nr:DoxX family protein [Actinoplanes sp. KI2]MCU7729470.1 DoxX family protein [Actinoplanes sp. KI2]
MRGNRFTEVVWALFRVVIGLLFALHGASTVFGVFGGNRGSGHAAQAWTWPGWYAGVIELVCGLLVLVGLLTVPAAILASGSMAYAYFTVHQPHALLPLENGGDAPALFCWAFLAIAVVGPGPWSIDGLLRSRTQSTAYETAEA